MKFRKVVKTTKHKRGTGKTGKQGTKLRLVVVTKTKKVRKAVGRPQAKKKTTRRLPGTANPGPGVK